jgi:hypothetical protein
MLPAVPSTLIILTSRISLTARAGLVVRNALLL